MKKRHIKNIIVIILIAGWLKKLTATVLEIDVFIADCRKFLTIIFLIFFNKNTKLTSYLLTAYKWDLTSCSSRKHIFTSL